MLFTTIFVLLLSVYQSQCIVMLRGEVHPTDGSALNDNLDGTTLTVRIEDISLQDVASVVLSERQIRLENGRKFPVYFELVYPKSIIDSETPAHFLAVSARITDTISHDLLYITDTNVQLPRDQNTDDLVTLNVIKIKEHALFDRAECQLPPEPGMCMAYFEKYYFDASSQSCKTFVYGGCGGNLNKFDTEEDCYSNCLPKAFRPDTEESTKDASVCKLEKEVGPCKAAITRFFYNRATNTCDEFTFGGCRGNGNNFWSAEECSKLCVKQ